MAIDKNLNTPVRGMQTDMYPGSLNGEQAYSYALNARQESEDGGELNITNEPSTTLSTNNFPAGYKIIGKLHIKELNQTVFWLVNPSTQISEIGIVQDALGDCLPGPSAPISPTLACDPTFSEPIELSLVPCQSYTTLISDTCLNFNVNHPVLKADYKLTNKSQEVYWTDGFNPPSWLTLNDIPRLSTGALDCNGTRIFPDYNVPTIQPIEVLESGSLITGAYQFFVSYSNSFGSEFSEYFSPTNATSVWIDEKTESFSFPTPKSIHILISNLDTRYSYFNIAVGKNIQDVESFEMVGTYPITTDTFDYTYTGDNKIAKPLIADDIFARYPYYTKAGTLESQDNEMMLGNLTTAEEINYQSVATNIELMWEAYSIPYNRFEGYSKGTNTANYRSYLRDEVYAFDAVFLTPNGKFSDRFPIPARVANALDLSLVTNQDAQNSAEDPCDPPRFAPRWKVYNTASIIGTSPGYTVDDCYVGPYKYGKFSYWESTDRYPNDPLVWGTLANQLIRHHKFPDELVIPRYSWSNTEGTIYPLGVKLDRDNVLLAIQNSSLTQEQKSNIVGIKIVRGNRSQNKSVKARGLLFNVGQYSYQGDNFLYPNYCFNDLNPDVYLSTESLNAITGLYESSAGPYSGQATSSRLIGFTPENKNRFVFMSPDTSFGTPALSGTLRLESIEAGKADAHIVMTQNHPRYEIGTQKGVKMAAVLAMSTVLSYSVALNIGDVFGIDTNMDINFNNFLPAFTQAYDLISKLVPFEDYGYQYNAVGNYITSIPVANDLGHKVRSIDVAGYLNPGMLTVPGEVLPINNYQRESSVYIRTFSALPYTHEIGGPIDNSRFTIGSLGGNTPIGQRVQRDISSFYATIKSIVPDQYGQIYSYPIVDTGSLLYLDQPFTTIFGGDTFINRYADKRKLAFFLQNTIGLPPNADIDYSQLGNVSYPTYYLSTGPVDPRISGSTLSFFESAYTILTGPGGILLGLSSGGLANFFIVAIALVMLMSDIVSTLGIKKVNFDRFEDDGFFIKGIFYLFAYGLPYFFVESDVNCDYRQAGATPEKDFYPNVGENIPDYWLQEQHVSINNDNYHLYNRSFSKQNIEDYFDHLPVDFNPLNDNVYHHSTRIIKSHPFTLEDLQNSWLTYNANDYRDYDLKNGTLVDINALEQNKVLFRFENSMSVRNAFLTMPTDNKDVAIGTGEVLAGPLVEYFKTNTGYAGTQNMAFVSTNYGQFWVDAKRGMVLHLDGEGVHDISRDGMKNFLRENLPFKIANSIPGIPTDNAYKDVGLSMVWDNRFERVIITKKDYICLVDGIQYDPITGNLIIVQPSIDDNRKNDSTTILDVNDTNYFCDASWTVAYSPLTKSWVSFYSYKPNFYIEQQNFFQSGIQSSSTDATLWNHLLTNRNFQVFYNTFYPFEIEPVTKAGALDKTLTSVTYRMDALRYTNEYDYKYMQYVTFDEACCYTNQQTSGTLKMHVRDSNVMTDGLSMVPGTNNVSIPVTQVNDTWRFNKFIDVTSDPNCLTPIMLLDCANTIRTPNLDAVDYTIVNDMRRRQRLKSDWFKIRLSNNKHSRYKMIFKWLLNKEIKSVR